MCNKRDKEEEKTTVILLIESHVYYKTPLKLWNIAFEFISSHSKSGKSEKRCIREKMQQTAAFEGIPSYIRNYFFDDNQAERNPITKLTCGLFELDDF